MRSEQTLQLHPNWRVEGLRSDAGNECNTREEAAESFHESVRQTRQLVKEGGVLRD